MAKRKNPLQYLKVKIINIVLYPEIEQKKEKYILCAADRHMAGGKYQQRDGV